MFVRLKPPQIISQFRWQHFRIPHKCTLTRHCSDIKTNEELLFTNIASKAISSPLRIKSALKAGYYDYFDGYACIQTVCAACVPIEVERGNANRSSDNKKCIYINKTTGDVVCSKCQYIFSYNAIEQFYNYKGKLADIQRNREMFMSSKPIRASLTASKIDKDAVRINEIDTNELQPIVSNLGLEHLIETLLQETGIYCNKSSKIIYFPMLDADSSISGFKTLSRTTNRGITETTIPETNNFGIVILPPFVKKGPKDQKTAILVLNMLDALALRREKQNVTIICLPHGFKMLPQECLPVLEPYQKLILWFEYDAAGWDMAKNFAKKLDEKRCHFIRPTENNPTPYLAMQQSIPLKTILSHAQPIAHKAVTTFRSLREDVLSDLHNIDKVQGVQWSRFPILNKYLQGHRRGELTVLTGPTGCGKTTFMAEYSLDLAMQGVNTLWGSFEIRNTLLARTLLQQLARKPLDENLEEFDEWADKFEELPMYFMTFYGQQPLKVVMEAVEHSQYVHDIQHVIIDNLQFMMGTSQDPRHFDKYWKQDEIISSFRTFATRRNCHVTLVIHPRKERTDEDLTINSIFGSAKATQEADNVLIIQDKRLISVKGKKYLQIAKNRHSGELGIMILEFDKDAKSYSQRNKSSTKQKKSKA